MATHSELLTLSLCSGVGMHDLGLGTVFHARTVCYVEREAFSASQLVALMEAECLDAAPVWSDLTTFDARPWRGIVDCLVAGLPCQPYSVAGKREGNADRRAMGDGDGPIVHFLRIVDESRPAVVFLENVPAWVTGGWFRAVGDELSRLGYELEAPLFLAADDVGASHQRERVWIMAYQPGRGQRVLRESWRGLGCAEQSDGDVADAQGGRGRFWLGDEQPRRAEAESAGGELGNATRSGCCVSECLGSSAGTGIHCAVSADGEVDDTASARRSRRKPGSGTAIRDEARRGEPSGRCDEVGSRVVVNAHDAVREGRRESSDASRRQEPAGHAGLASGSLFAPGPLSDRWAGIITHSPHLAPATEPGVHGMADGFAWVVDESRRHQLRALGNGGVPLCSAVAWATLARRILT